ncbi:MarR family transcriptional regulator [Methanosarcina sp. MSH10X1]|uniref:MarR family winged helix-turn-helix transcriptional regulator n=1 Tax=Methanosarcina sp. MSH10X1 TaxID=2507075 RepID=UPI000FFC0F67|nr:MarR family winged helix-turn-helix transcriptional regulator [Methanosarcina sp. MSH10X1]RXA19902.1 MarR family transcriptional regulator [Methanosarcina sp. MSH10X1]
MSDENAEKLFLQEKPTRALLFIGSMGKTYASVISKEIDSTFAHTTRILAKMEQCGLIRFTFEGRIKFVELTEYGREVETALKEFRDIIAEEPPKDQQEETRITGAEREKAVDGEEGNEPEQAKELDPLSAEILEKVKKLRNKIESIYRDAVEQGDSRDTISRKLGPYSRDIKKLQNQIERAESPIDETVILALEESEALLETYLRS